MYVYNAPCGSMLVRTARGQLDDIHLVRDGDTRFSPPSQRCVRRSHGRRCGLTLHALQLQALQRELVPLDELVPLRSVSKIMPQATTRSPRHKHTHPDTHMTHIPEDCQTRPQCSVPAACTQICTNMYVTLMTTAKTTRK